MKDSSNSYTSKESAAPSLGVLLEKLLTEDDGRFLYRGQTKQWPGPLLPSAYRKYRRTGNIYNKISTEYVHTLRNTGNYFVELIPINGFSDSICLFYPEGVTPTREEAKLLDWIRTSQFFARAIRNDEDFLSVLSPSELARYGSNLVYWKQAIDNHHRAEIRDLVFMEPFGYLLGQSLAQQYGFSSEMLDITSNPTVAGFFASYKSPTYLNVQQEGIGVIYRFPRTTPLILEKNVTDYNFYTCPEMINIENLFAEFVNSDNSSLTSVELEDFLIDSFKARRWRRLVDFKVSNAQIRYTRFSRQSAAFLVPDLLFLEIRGQERTPNGYIVFLAIEDLSTREGVDVYYFHHTKSEGESVALSREYLWPNEEDSFFEMIGNALTYNVVTESGRILPNRVDLLDPGYRWE